MATDEREGGRDEREGGPGSPGPGPPAQPGARTPAPAPATGPYPRLRPPASPSPGPGPWPLPAAPGSRPPTLAPGPWPARGPASWPSPGPSWQATTTCVDARSVRKAAIILAARRAAIRSGARVRVNRYFYRHFGRLVHRLRGKRSATRHHRSLVDNACTSSRATGPSVPGLTSRALAVPRRHGGRAAQSSGLGNKVYVGGPLVVFFRGFFFSSRPSSPLFAFGGRCFFGYTCSASASR